MSEKAQFLSGLSPLKLTSLARDMRGRAAPVLQADPIAVVGMACRVPGASSPEEFWTLLREGRDATSDIPKDRWNAEDWYDPEIAAHGKSITRRGGFIDQIDQFDAPFFGILPREADAMDPQQRVFLECAIEALDDAGQPLQDLRGTRTGVFVASYHSDYQALSYNDISAVDLRTLTGTVHSVVPNRLSYFLDLRGPSISIDTACSSSLVALHMACQSLRIGEADLAVTGGVSLMITPDLMVSLSKVGFMAPDGRSKAFDKSADGFGRGEGCGVLALKRMSDAIADGDRIYALIRGSSVNQDGESTLLTAPNGPAQQDLIREALDNAQVSADSITFVEAHGTGTELGDPIEVEAIAATVGQSSGGTGPCYLGTCKANLGHLEAAAGVVGVIKSVLALHHREMPGQPCFETLSPHISLDGTRLRIPQSLTPLAPDTTLRAGVSGFGVGGTNAHVILESAPDLGAAAGLQDTDDRPLVLPISAQTPDALAAGIKRWQSFLSDTSENLRNICHTAAQRRTRHMHRVAVHGATTAEMAERLAQFAQRGMPAAADRDSKLAFVFCGQGPQRFGMGQELAQVSPEFRQALEECDAALSPHWGHSLFEELARPEDSSRLSRTEIAQPALFSIQMALAAMWKARGVVPQAVAGHSVGEIAALHVAGALDLETAAKVVCHRAQIMQRADGHGAMASVNLPEDAVRKLLAEAAGDLCIAAVNAPESCVVSGGVADVEAFEVALSAKGVALHRLPVRYAFHSAQMDALLPDLKARLAGIAGSEPRIPIYSSATGDLLKTPVGVEHFCRNVREPVRFADAISALSRDGMNCFAEIGPHPVLAGAIRESAGTDQCSVVATLRRGRADADSIAEATAALFTSGITPDWSAVLPEGAVVSAPSYPWQHRRHWLAASAPAQITSRTEAGLHPLMSSHQHVASHDIDVFEGAPHQCWDWLSEHRVFGQVLMPGTAMLEAFAAAAVRTFGSGTGLRDFAISAPLPLDPENTGLIKWQITVERTANGGGALTWHSWDGKAWTQTATAGATAVSPDIAAAPELVPETSVHLTENPIYCRSGLDLGPVFQRLRDVTLNNGAATASLSASNPPEGFLVHPALLDAGFQLASALIDGRMNDPELPAYLPLGAASFVADANAEPVAVQVEITDRSPATFSADLSYVDRTGAVCAQISGAEFVRADRLASAGSGPVRPYIQNWTAVASPEDVRDMDGRWLLVNLDSGSEMPNSVADMLRRAGQDVAGIGTDPAQNPDDIAGWFTAQRTGAGDIRHIVLCCAPDPATTDPDGRDRAGSADGAIAALTICQSVLRVWPDDPPRVTLLTKGAEAAVPEDFGDPGSASVAGLISALALEHPELRPRIIDLDPNGSDDLALPELLADAPFHVTLRGADRLSPGLEPWAPDEPGHHHLEITGAKTATGVALRPIPSQPLQPGEVRIEMRASGVNFRDVLSTLGMYPGAPVALGNEGAGVVTEFGPNVSGLEIGQRVMGLIPWSHGTEAVAPAHLLVPVPETLSDVHAAATPVAFLTAAYGLHELAGLKSGDTVLIHAAAGGVGLAAVQLALRAGATVFATAGSDRKRDFLRSLGVSGVFSSRDLEFASRIMDATEGRGVDVVLNSLSDDFLTESFHVVAQGGVFLELGKRGILSPDAAKSLRPDISYHAFDLGAEALDRPGLVKRLIDPVLTGFDNGSLTPLPVQQFALRDAPSAFRHMAQARHMGKIVLRSAGAQFSLDPAASYWITGGTGAIGLDAARWLAARGARNIVLSSRAAAGTRDIPALEELQALGVEILVVQADAADRSAMAAALAQAQTLGSLKGVVHAAGVLRDAAFSRQSAQDVSDVFRSKVDGAYVLDELTSSLHLDFFLLLSGAGLKLGSPGQAAYSAANAAIDALARRRHARGLPATCMSLGPWQGAGMAEKLKETGRDIWGDRGVLPIAPERGFDQAETLIGSACPWSLVADIDWSRFMATIPDGLETGYFHSIAAPDPVDASPPDTSAAADVTPVQELRTRPPAERYQALLDLLADLARTTIGLTSATEIAPQSALKDAGLDSLMAVEFRNTLVRVGGRPLPVTLLFDHPTLDTLVTKMAEIWDIGISTAEPDPEDAEVSEPGAADLDDISEEEALALLQAELDGGASR